ncbi:MAG: alpha-glucan family phosphorylase [Myxococcota bacterium]
METTAYFSAEIGFSVNVPTYSGGLGVLAGDHLKAAADKGLPLVGVTLMYREGYFRQHLDADGQQTASYPRFIASPRLEQLAETVEIPLEGRILVLGIWRTHLYGCGHSGEHIPILFLDSDRPDNSPEDRQITHRLYGGDQSTRLRQEAVLGFGGLLAVQKLYPQAKRYHLNEGHCAFLTLGLLREGLSVDEIRQRCHFTTHTPVPAGHDVFDYEAAKGMLGGLLPENITELAGEDALSMSELALSLCGTANGVSKLHGEVARKMFPGRDIGHITNGVHHLTWVCDVMAQLFDAHIPGWRDEPRRLASGAVNLPTDALMAAHQTRKTELVTYANAQTALGFAENILTIGFARRAASYKRADLLFRDLERLVKIGEGKLQIIFAGKAHPRDTLGQGVIQRVFEASRQLAGRIRVGYIANYSMWSGALITSGVDVWLNTPKRPREASGTSGMKAVLNGVPNASISDGWWAEGARDGENGWILGDPQRDTDDAEDVASLYRILEERIIPTFYADNREPWANLMRQAIATGADFTAARMVVDYAEKYYS